VHSHFWNRTVTLCYHFLLIYFSLSSVFVSFQFSSLSSVTLSRALRPSLLLVPSLGPPPRLPFLPWSPPPPRLYSHHRVVVSATDFRLYAASLHFEDDVDGVCNWKVSLFLTNDAISLGNFHGLLSHARLSAVGSKIFIIDRNTMVRYDTDMWRVVCQAPRRRYGCIGTSVEGVFYMIGGGPGLWKRDTGERDKEREGKNKKIKK